MSFSTQSTLQHKSSIGKQALNEAQTIVSKVGGDNAVKFQENARKALKTSEEGKKRVFVFSAIRSSAPIYSDYALPLSQANGKPKPGFNTTSHLIEIVKIFQSGASAENYQKALKYAQAVRDFTEAVIQVRVENEFHETLLDCLHTEIAKLQEKIKELFHCESSSILALGEDYIFYNPETNTSFSFTGFGESLAQRLYQTYFELKGIQSGSIEIDDINQSVLNSPSQSSPEVFKAKIAEIRCFINEKTQALLSKNDVVVAGGYLPFIASKRGYSDVTGAEMAKAVAEGGFQPVYLIEKGDPIMSGDPRIVEKAQVVPIMTYSFAAELFGPIGAEAGAIHSNAVAVLENSGINIVVMNPEEPSKGSTLITRDYHPSPGPMEIIATRRIPAMVSIESTDMISTEGVTQFITEYFKGLLIEQVYTTERTLIITFSDKVTKEQADKLEDLLRERFSSGYSVRLQDELSYIFCLGNKINTLRGISHAGKVFADKGIEAAIGVFVTNSSVISFVVSQDDAERAVKLLHNQITYFSV